MNGLAHLADIQGSRVGLEPTDTFVWGRIVLRRWYVNSLNAEIFF